MRRALALVVLVATAGCGPLSTTHHNPGSDHAVATSAPSPLPGEPHVEIAIAGGQVSPPSGWLELRKGQTITLTITGDVADEVHVHGYDLKAALTPGKPVTLRFEVNMTGVFQVETHESKLVLTQLAVT